MGENFKNGGSHLEPEWALQEHTLKNGMVGYGPSKNDPNGSCYWADKDNMLPIWQHHDSNIAEHELGFDKGDLNGESRYRVDCNDLSIHNQRIANGYEQGANNNFTGIVAIDENGNKTIDPAIYNQRTSGGQPECVSDQIPLNECRVSGPQKFDDPNQITEAHCNRADTIAAMPEGETKDAKLDKWNTDAAALQNRMSGEQDYLKGRIADHEKRMSEFPEGTLEYNRAKENRDWCQDYYNELGNSKEQLQNKQNEINNVNALSTTSTTVSGTLPPQSTNPPALKEHENHTAGQLPQREQQPQIESGNRAVANLPERNQSASNNQQISGELPPQNPQPSVTNGDYVSGTLPPQSTNPPASQEHQNQISGTLPDQAQGIELPNNHTGNADGKDLAENATKNNNGFDPFTGIS